MTASLSLFSSLLSGETDPTATATASEGEGASEGNGGAVLLMMGIVRYWSPVTKDIKKSTRGTLLCFASLSNGSRFDLLASLNGSYSTVV